MQEGVDFHLDGLAEDGLPLPMPSTVEAPAGTTVRYIESAKSAYAIAASAPFVVAGISGYSYHFTPVRPRISERPPIPV
jgi:hypothetical protein